MMTDERERIVVSIHDLGRTILRAVPVILCWSVFCCLLLVCYKELYKKPTFTADTSIYVLSRTADSDYGRLDISDLDVSHQMARDALDIIGSEQVAEEVLANLEGDAVELKTMRATELLDMIDIRKQDDSLEITISVSGADPYAVCDIANTYRETVIRELNTRVMAQGVQTTKEAVIPLGPSGRSSGFYGAAGLFLGLCSSIGLITLVYTFGLAERDAEDVRDI